MRGNVKYKMLSLLLFLLSFFHIFAILSAWSY